MRILIIEDEAKVARFLEQGLREEGYAVEVALDPVEGLAIGLRNPPEVIILDVLMPGRDGFSVLRDLRAAQVPSRILMLTALEGVPDRVRGLDLGADDYLVKPFAFAELLARIRSLLRRGAMEDTPVMAVADLRLEPRTRRVTRAGRLVSLSAKEFAVLAHLLQRTGQVVTRAELAEEVWEDLQGTPSNVIEVTVYHLREKIDRGHDPALIQTVRGAGYVLKAP